MGIGPGLPIGGSGPDFARLPEKTLPEVRKEIASERDEYLNAAQQCEDRGDAKGAELYRKFADGLDNILRDIDNGTIRTPELAMQKHDQLPALIGIQEYLDHPQEWDLSQKQIEDLRNLKQEVIDGRISPQEAIDKSTYIVTHK